MIKWSKAKKVKPISNVYGITCNDVNSESIRRRLSSVDYNRDYNDYDQWSFYIVCIIIIMNALCLPYACVKCIGQNLKPTDKNHKKYYTTNSMTSIIAGSDVNDTVGLP
eukprot:UN12291